jgi:antitoxin (DNA-binding transcriptional repressor) of toxin-antitoxin stability system
VSTTLSIEEAQAKLAELLKLAQAGHEVIIQDSAKGRTKLVPFVEPPSQGPRVLGLHKGNWWMADDFDAALPDSFWFPDETK